MERLTKEDLIEIQELLDRSLKPDTVLVNQSREAINNLKDNQPDKLVLSLLYILIHGEKNYNLCAVLLRQLLSVMDESDNFVWRRLSIDTKAVVKLNLARIVPRVELDFDVRCKVCIVCSELAGTVVDCDEVWTELLNAMNVLLNQEVSDDMKMCGFRLLADTFSYFSSTYVNHLKELKSVFERTLMNDSFAVRAECFKAVIAVISCIEELQKETFEDVIPLITDSIIAGWKDEQALKSIILDLTTLADTNARFLKKGFSKLFKVCIALVKTVLKTKEVPELAIELLVTAIERAPSLLLEDKMIPEIGVYFSELFDAILYLMGSNVKEFPRDWVNPTDSLELPFDDSISLGQNAIDRVLNCTKREFGLSLLDPQILKLFSGDWSCKYVALLAGARIGPFVRSPEELSVFIPSICARAIKSSDPRIKLGAVRAIRNLTEESDVVFHYHKEIMDGLLGILGDRIGRLKQEGCIALRSFIERLKKQDVDRYVIQLMKSLTTLIDTDNEPVDGIAMSTIGVLVEVTPETFYKHFYTKIMPILAVYLNSPEAKFITLREQLIEVLTIIAKSVGKEKFRAYFPQLAREMTELQKAQLLAADLERMSLFPSWERMCKLYTVELVPFVGEIVESLINLAKSPIQTYMNITGIHIEDYSEKKKALMLLSLFIEYLGLEKHTTIIEELLISILLSQNNEALKIIAAKSLRNLLITTKGRQSMKVKNALVALMEALRNEKELKIVEPVITSIRDLLLTSESQCFNEAEALEALEGLIQFASNSRLLLLKEQVEESPGKSLILLGQSIGALIKSHPNETAEIFQMIYPKLLKVNLLNSSSNSQVIFALTIISAGLRYLTYTRIPEIYEEILGYVTQFAMSVNLQIRAVAVEGLADAVFGTAQHSISVADQCVEYIAKILGAALPEQVSRKNWEISKEKAVISLGQIMFSQAAHCGSRTFH
jgi:hypothetical protein